MIHQMRFSVVVVALGTFPYEPGICQKPQPTHIHTHTHIHTLSGPVFSRYRETISAIPPYYALWGFWCLNMANWVRYPLLLFWAFPPWRACEVEVRYPPPRGISAILARYPMKIRHMGAIPPSAILSRQGNCAIWATKRTQCVTHTHTSKAKVWTKIWQKWRKSRKRKASQHLFAMFLLICLSCMWRLGIQNIPNESYLTCWAGFADILCFSSFSKGRAWVGCWAHWNRAIFAIATKSQPKNR